MEFNLKVQEIFQNAYRNKSSHNAGILFLNDFLKLCPASGTEERLEIILKGCVDRVLIISKSEVGLDRIFSFISRWLAESSVFVFNSTMIHLLDRANATEKVVRMRSCQLLSLVFRELPKEKSIIENIWIQVREVITRRLHDKVSSVRLWAARASEYIQDSGDENDFVTENLAKLMESEASIDVRLAALESVNIGKNSLRQIIERTRDTDAQIRLAAYHKLTTKGDPRYLTYIMRGFLIKHGLKDRDESVVNAAKQMLLKWLDVYDSIPQLLHMLGLHTHQVEAGMFVKVISDEVFQNPNCSVELKEMFDGDCIDWTCDINKIASSELFWTLSRCEYSKLYLSPNVSIEVTERLLPDAVRLCSLLKDIASMSLEEENDPNILLKFHFLLKLTTYTDMADEVGRRELVVVSKSLLVNLGVTDDLVKPILSIWMRSEEESDVIAGVIVIIKSLWAIAEETEKAEDGSNSDEADLALIRAMMLAVWVLQQVLINSDLRDSIPSIRGEVDMAMQQKHPDLRALGNRCYGLLGLLSCEGKDVADSVDALEHSRIREVMLQTVQFGLEYQEEIFTLAQALQTLSDMAMVTPDSTNSNGTLNSLLMRLLEGEQNILFRTAAEASVKLLFGGVLTDPRLFAQLLKIFFLPKLYTSAMSDEEKKEEEEECQAMAIRVLGETTLGSAERLQQMLGVFFKNFFRAGAGREYVALAATVELVSDMTYLIRDGQTEVESLLQIIDRLLVMSESSEDFQAVTSGPLAGLDEPAECDQNVKDQLHRAICLRVAASILRELLKLGNGAVDRVVSKELLKILVSISSGPVHWITPCVAPAVSSVIGCILNRFGSDKSGLKVLEKLQALCESMPVPTEDCPGYHESWLSMPYCHPFFALAPGLSDLVQLAGNGDDSRSSSSSFNSLGSKSRRVPPRNNKSPTTSSPFQKKTRKLVGRAENKRSNSSSVVADRSTIKDIATKSPLTKRDKQHVLEDISDEDDDDDFSVDKENYITTSGNNNTRRMSSRISSIKKPVRYFESAIDIEEGDEEDEKEEQQDNDDASVERISVL